MRGRISTLDPEQLSSDPEFVASVHREIPKERGQKAEQGWMAPAHRHHHYHQHGEGREESQLSSAEMMMNILKAKANNKVDTFHDKATLLQVEKMAARSLALKEAHRLAEEQKALATPDDPTTGRV